MSDDIRLSEKFLSFHKVIDEQQFLFYIILSNHDPYIITFVHNSIK